MKFLAFAMILFSATVFANSGTRYSSRPMVDRDNMDSYSERNLRRESTDRIPASNRRYDHTRRYDINRMPVGVSGYDSDSIFRTGTEDSWDD